MTFSKKIHGLAGVLAIGLLAETSEAALEPAGLVRGPGGDVAADCFVTLLPVINTYLGGRYQGGSFGEGRAFTSPGSSRVRPQDLTSDTLFSARVYFVAGDAGRGNQLGFNMGGFGGPQGGGAPASIFPDASSSPGGLLQGSFVDLGIFAAGTQLQFFLTSAAGGGTFSTKSFSSPDGAAQEGISGDNLQHVVEFKRGFQGNVYAFLGFEDSLNGGDRDFNDVLFALEFKPAGLSTVPEPGFYMAGAALVCGSALFLRRRAR